jgi:hypothetical protein
MTVTLPMEPLEAKREAACVAPAALMSLLAERFCPTKTLPMLPAEDWMEPLFAAVPPISEPPTVTLPMLPVTFTKA